jgi:hypothetical protein
MRIPFTDISVAPDPRTFGTIARIASPPYHLTCLPAQPRPTTPSITALSTPNGLPPRQSSPSGPLNIDMRNFAVLSPHPFSWTRALNWSWIKTLIQDNKAIIGYPDVRSMRLAALSYQAYPISTICATSDVNANFAQYLVSALLNNMSAALNMDLNNMYSWLGKLPKPVMLQFLNALPPGHSDVLRERIFVAAMDKRDSATVQSILETGFDLHEPINFAPSQDPVLPLVWAFSQHDYPVARTILMYASRMTCTQGLDNLMVELLRGFEKYEHRSTLQWPDLLQVLIDAGAKPTARCLQIAKWGSAKLFRYVLEHMEDGFHALIATNVLQDSVSRRWFLSSPEKRDSVYGLVDFPDTRLMLSYFLQERLDKIKRDSPASTFALREAFRWAVQEHILDAMNMILNAAVTLQIGLCNCIHDVTSACLVSAYRDLDWTLLRKLTREVITEHKKPTEEEAWIAEKELRGPSNEHDNRAYECLISDWDLLIRRLEQYDLSSKNFGIIDKSDILHLLATGCSPDFDDILVAWTVNLARTGTLENDSVVGLLERSKIMIISQILSLDQHWNYALQCARSQQDFEHLNDLLYHTGKVRSLAIKPIINFKNEQLTLRALSYHAIFTKDDMLLRWLLETGLSTCKLQLDGGEDGVECGVFYFPPPSLLAVAASDNNVYMIQILLDEGVESKDSEALMYAITGIVDIAVIETLLAAVGNVQRKKRYGGAALRAAIWRQDHDILRLLSKEVDVNSIEHLSFEDRDGFFIQKGWLSPMGQAILCRDLKAAEILIEHGAIVGGLVTLNYDFAGMNGGSRERHLSQRGTDMERATTILAAIDTENLPMVKLLVENGANVNHSFNPGLVRTPLQRAAEIGSFEVAQYLLEQGADVNSAPCYSGGTPLQLTAIGGHVGVAELLLEHGANANYLPAEGHGRTAFEGAAEWGRVDMMSLLVSKGLNFDLVVDKDGHTQYERAMNFAEKSGRPASKRFVQRLREESGVDVINWSAVMGE